MAGLLWFAIIIVALGTLARQATGQEKLAVPAPRFSPPANAEPTDDEKSVDDQGVGPGPATPPPGTDSSDDRIQYVGPDTYILLDTEGRPQPMPGMTYEDFMAAWKQSRQSDVRRRDRRYSIESLQVRGRAFERYAKLHLTMDVQLLTSQETMIPLGLGGAILESHPQVSYGARRPSSDLNKRDESGNRVSPRDPCVDYDSQQRGYVARLAGEADQRCTLLMDLLIPIEQNGEARTLETNWPRALTSNLVLDVESDVAEVTVSDGAVLSQEASANNGTRLTVVGLAGQFRLAWSAAQADVAEPATVLSATGAMLVTIDGRSVQTDARIGVQSFGGKFDRFRVLLPPGAKLIQDRPATSSAVNPAPKMKLSVESSPAEAGHVDPGQERQVVLVELPEKQQGPIEIKLLTEQPIGLREEDSSVELAGFEVVGAVRQFGDIALRAANDWQLRWELGGQVRQVDAVDLPPALQQPGVTAAFQYDRQPWSLAVNVTARQSRVHVTSEYELQCLPDEARLRVRLAYQVLGARTFEFRVDLNDWELTADPVESNGLVDSDRIMLTRDGTLILPLTQAASRRAEIVFNLRRPTSRNSSRVRLPLPIPRAESIGAGTLVVGSSEGIELMPESSRLPGLSPLPITHTTGSLNAADFNQFRYRCYLPDAEFVAERISRAREVATEIETHVELSSPDAKVIQRIDYGVRYEPIKDLVFEVPEELLAEDRILDVGLSNSATVAGGQPQRVSVPLTVLPVAEEYRSADIRGARRLRASLPQALLGEFSVTIDYSLSRSRESSDGGFVIPLVRPADGELNRQRAIVDAPREFTVALSTGPAESSWRTSPRPGDLGNAPLELFATHGELMLPLSIQSVDLDLPSPTIDRVWLQTWLAGAVRQDRASYQFRSAGAAIAVELPPGVPSEEVEVLLDGRSPKASTSQAGRIIVLLSKNRSPEPEPPKRSPQHTLEVRFRQPIELPTVARHRLSPPQLVGSDSLAEIYWQIVAPSDHHVIQAPRNLSATSQWQWLGGFWGRRATKSQADLEEWIGATTQLAPTEDQNEYLYSGLAPVASIEVVTAPRWLIVLVASACCLLPALAWIYVPFVRKGWVILAVASTLVALAIVYPNPAMLLGQAAVLGVVMSILAVLISRLVARPLRFAPSARSSGSTLRQATPRADSHLLVSTAPAASTSPTAPLHQSESG